MSDLIERQKAIDALCSECQGRCIPCENYPCGEVEAINALPSAQPDIKQAAKLLSDFIECCPGGESYLITPNGEELRTDWGYAMEGIQLIHDWAERRIDE